MLTTPKSLRLQIAIIGRMNAGKSSVLNLLTGQEVSITAPVAGTTTDVVEKNQELHGVGPVTWIDTAGLDDVSELGIKRTARTRKALEKADIVLVVCEGNQIPHELIADIQKPMIYLFNKADLYPLCAPFRIIIFRKVVFAHPLYPDQTVTCFLLNPIIKSSICLTPDGI